MRLIAEGLSNLEISRKLTLNPLTVRNYISRLLLKYGARNRTELICFLFLLNQNLFPGFYHKGAAKPRLSRIEIQIIELTISGKSNKQIGRILFYSPLTIRNYVSNLLVKFHARNRSELVIKYVSLQRYYHRRIILRQH